MRSSSSRSTSETSTSISDTLETTVYDNVSADKNAIKWCPPIEIASYPVLMGTNYYSKEIFQGELKNEGFLSACAIAIQQAGVVEKVIPESGDLAEGGEGGTLCFRFWKEGMWEDVFVDERLPTKNGRLLFARSIDSNELWIPYLEKAYARFLGSYEATERIGVEDALRNLTGGIVEVLTTSSSAEAELFATIYHATRSTNSFIAAIQLSPKNLRRKWGIVADQGYTVTDAKIILVRGNAQKLLQLRYPTTLRVSATNPSLSDSKKDYYWITVREFVQKFAQVIICTQKPDGISRPIGGYDPVFLVHHGVWKGQSCGGSHWDNFGYSKNPQYLLTVTRADDHDPSRKFAGGQPGLCSVLLSLLQKNPSNNAFQINFSVYETPDYTSRLSGGYLRSAEPVFQSGAHKRSLEISGRVDLKPGNYVIVPSTFRKHQEGAFVIRASANQPILMKFLPQHPPQYLLAERRTQLKFTSGLRHYA